MNASDLDKTCIYLVDATDRIVFVNENWLPFAEENQASESCHPSKIINQSIWKFVDGSETKHLYRIIMSQVRKSQTPVSFPFRCDAPDKRRYLELTIAPLKDGMLEFTSSVSCEEIRDSVALLEIDTPRGDQWVRMCSMCKKVEVSDRRWEEVETAIAEMRLFDHHLLPSITHGLCPECAVVWKAGARKFMKKRAEEATPLREPLEDEPS